MADSDFQNTPRTFTVKEAAVAALRAFRPQNRSACMYAVYHQALSSPPTRVSVPQMSLA
jgi:hypothetical protein